MVTVIIRDEIVSDNVKVSEKARKNILFIKIKLKKVK